MQELKDRIMRDGRCLEGGILKVDNFINHQMDPMLMKACAIEFVRLFANEKFNKIVTIEASGIAPAILVGSCGKRCARPRSSVRGFTGWYGFYH